MATHPERIVDLCRDCVHQMAYIKQRRCLRSGRDAPLLGQVSRIEHRPDREYHKLLKRYISRRRICVS